MPSTSAKIDGPTRNRTRDLRIASRESYKCDALPLSHKTWLYRSLGEGADVELEFWAFL